MKAYRLLLCVGLFMLAACSESTPEIEPTSTVEFVERTIYVAPSTEPCVSGSGDCLLVRESIADAWQQFDGTLNGFDYEAGYTYKLQLRGDSAETTSWDLVEVLSQEGSFETAQQETQSAGAQVWHLDYMLTNEITLDNDITMILGEDEIQGSGGCNNYTAAFRAEGINGIAIEGIGASKKLCEETIAQQERDYFDALSMIAEYEQVDGSTLIFRDVQGTPVLTFVTTR